MTELSELFDFLENEREDVLTLAISHVLSYTKSPSYTSYFKNNEYKATHILKSMTQQTTIIAHDAISSLINLTSIDDEITKLLIDKEFIQNIILSIIVPKSILADLNCMLLNNLTKNINAIRILVEETNYLDPLLEVFVRSRDFNPKADFHFLACVFANLSATIKGALFFASDSSVDNTPRLLRLLACTQSKNLIRRGGVVSVLKNISYYQETNDIVLQNESFLVSILLPLCGDESFTDDEMEGMPDDLQFLEKGKSRESDCKLRLMLVEAVLALTQTLNGREVLRNKQVYCILQKMHLTEEDEKIREVIEEIVDLLKRDEDEQKSIDQSKRITEISELDIIDSGEC